ncbi:MAG TPA: hypothetical protein VFM88_22175 [Vicinamibacteria bacterium]|nr:hypothetical protein [Vicinamibacteria bacterium]
MKTVEITEASLADYGREGDERTWVLTRDGKPVAAVLPIPPGMDAETFALSHNADFIKIINRSWKDYEQKGGIPLDEVRRKHGLKPKAVRSATRRSR